MSLTRRQFLIGSTLLLASPLASAATSIRYLSAASNSTGKHYLIGLDAEGNEGFRTPMPGRAHGMTVTPDGASCLLSARRPGRWLVQLSLADGSIRTRVEAAEGRHYNGHGCLDPSGRLFYTSENDYDGERGVIGIHAVDQGLARIGELPSHGIGPHELKMLPDGRTLAVANGGILTHPDSGRAKLNLPGMRPNLAYIDRHSGELLSRVEPPEQWHQLSIRHLDVNAMGQVAIAMQYQGPSGDAVPLVALHQPGQELRFLELPEAQRRRLRQYCGSVRFDRSGRWLAVSAPRGNRVLFFQANGQYAAHLELRDACGITGTGKDHEFVLSNGTGELHRYRADRNQDRVLGRDAGLSWDNHMQQV